MAVGAHYRIDQASNPIPTGTTDVARVDVWQSRTVHLVGDSSSGQASPQWTILAWPDGASRTQPTNAATFDATYTFPTPGSYLIEFAVNAGLGADVVQFVVRVTRDTNGLIYDDSVAEPAFGEIVGADNANSNDRGYAKVYEVAIGRQMPAIGDLNTLINTRPNRHKHVHLVRVTTAADQAGGGDFFWDSTSTEPHNGGTIIQPGFGTGAAMATGRWKRQYSGPVYVTWFGADPTGVADCATAFTAACNASRHIIFPPGTYKIGNSGWSVPRGNITLDFSDGAQIRHSGTIVFDHANIAVLGRCFGFDFSGTFKFTFVWTGATNGKMWVCSQAGPADGMHVHGISFDGALTSGLVGVQIGTGGFSCSGMQWGTFTMVDVPGRADHGAFDVRAACEQSAFHAPYLGFRLGSLGTGVLGASFGASSDNDGAITSCTFGDGGGTVSGFNTGIQVGGANGRCSTVAIGGPAFFVIEATRSKNAVGVLIYDAFTCGLRGGHVEMHGALIANVSTAANGVITTVQPHGFAGGEEILITNTGGTTNINGVRTVTVTGASTFTVGVSTIGQTYTSGGLVNPTSPSQAHRDMIVGHAGTSPEACYVAGTSYLAGASYAIETLGFDQFTIGESVKFDVSGGGSPTNPAYAVKNTGGGLRRVEGKIPVAPQVGRGNNYGGDLSDATGFMAYDTANRDVNNDIVGLRYFDGTYESPVLRNPKVTKDLEVGIQYTITDITNTTPAVVTFSAAHKLRTGDTVFIEGTGAVQDGDFAVTYLEATKVSLQGSTANGTAATGTATVEGAFRIKACPAFLASMINGALPEFKVANNAFMILRNRTAATAGAQIVKPLGFITYLSVWDGAAPQPKNFGWTLDGVVANPFYGYLDGQINGGSVFAVDALKQVWPFGHAGNRIVYGTGAAPNTAAPDGTDWAVGDRFVRTDVSPGGVSQWACTTPGHAGTVVWKAECTLAA